MTATPNQWRSRSHAFVPLPHQQPSPTTHQPHTTTALSSPRLKLARHEQATGRRQCLRRQTPALALAADETSGLLQPPLVAHVITDCPAGSRGAVPRPFERGREYGGPAVSDHRHAGALEQPSGRRRERQSAQISRTRRDNSEKSCVAWYQGESQNTEAPRTDAGVPSAALGVHIAFIPYRPTAPAE